MELIRRSKIVKIAPLVLGAMFATSHAAKAAPTVPPARIYASRCAVCHGDKGQGGTGVSFKGKLRISAPKEVARVIREGIPGTAMPPSADLNEKDSLALAAFVLQLHRSK